MKENFNRVKMKGKCQKNHRAKGYKGYGTPLLVLSFKSEVVCFL